MDNISAVNKVIYEAYIDILLKGKTPSVKEITERAFFAAEAGAYDVIYGDEIMLEINETNVQRFLVNNKHYHYHISEHYDCQRIIFKNWFDFQLLLN